MRIAHLSVRKKMMLPAVVAAASTVVATALALQLLSGAGRQLDRAQAVAAPALQLLVEQRSALEQLRLHLRNAASSRDPELVREADALRDQAQRQLDEGGPATIGAEEAGELRQALAAYHQVARAATLQAAGAPAINGRGTIPLEGEVQYVTLRNRLVAQTEQARLDMDEAFHGARARQRWAIVLSGAILIAAALLSALLAWWLSGRTARPIATLSAAALRVADGDLTPTVTAEGQDEVGVLARSFQRMVGRLRELVSMLASAAEELGLAVDQLSEHTRAQSALLERQASAVAETSSTTRELEQTSSVAASRANAVLEVARRAAEMSDLGQASAERSAGELRRIQGSVESIVGQSTQLLEQARQIGDIVETVQDLATQSHVLSLNASIEAARAGEAGKSFAVVAQEVRALAEQSGQGAGRIARVVDRMQAAVRDTRATTERGSQGMAGSLEQIRVSGESLKEIGGIVRETSDAALHIATAVQQQSAGIGQIAVAMRDLDRGMEDAVGRIRALELSAQKVAETATRISEVAVQFQV